MSEQNTEFEKWAEDHEYAIDDYVYALEIWNAATAEANKRVEALEGEVAELQRENLTIHEAIEVIAGKFVEQVALSKRLREALGQLITHTLECEKRLDEFHGLGDNAGSGCSDVICNSKQALSATPAESLQAFENEVLERAAKVAMDMPSKADEIHEYRYSDDCKAMAWDISHAIRAIKEVK